MNNNPDNSSSNSRLVKNTLVLNLRLLLTILIGLYFSRLVLQVLGVEDFGLYTLVGGFVSLLTVVTSAVTGATGRFITVELGKGDLSQTQLVVSSVINVLALLSLFVALIAAIIGPWFITGYLTIPPHKLHLAIQVYICSVAVFILNLLVVPFVSLVTAHEHMTFFAIMSIYTALSKLLIIFSLRFWGQDKLLLFSILLVAATLLNLLVYALYCRISFPETRYRFVFNPSVMKHVLSFSVWMGIGSAAGVLKDQGGNILVNMFFGLSLNAAYGIATQVGSLLAGFGATIGTAISPQITKSFSAGNQPRAVQLTYLYVKCTGLIMLFAAVPLLANTNFILDLWLDQVPDFAVAFTQLFIIVTFFHVLSMTFGPIYLAHGHIRNFQLFMAAVNIFYLPLCYLLLRLFHSPFICLWVSIALESFFVVADFLYLKRQIDFPVAHFFRSVLLPLLLIAALSFALSYAEKSLFPDSLANVIQNTLFSSLIISLFAFFAILNPQEKHFVRSFLQSHLSKLRLHQ